MTIALCEVNQCSSYHTVLYREWSCRFGHVRERRRMAVQIKHAVSLL